MCAHAPLLHQPREQDQHPNRSERRSNQIQPPEQHLDLGLRSALEQRLLDQLLESLRRSSAVSTVAQITRIANRLNASPLEKYVFFHWFQKYAITANIVPVCSITSSSVICGDEGSSPISFSVNNNVSGTRDGQQFGQTLHNGKNNYFENRHNLLS